MFAHNNNKFIGIIFIIYFQTNMLQTLSRLHPYIIKQQKQWNRVLLLWLQFYEIFTRYPDIASGAK